jgi:hypothetical protein
MPSFVRMKSEHKAKLSRIRKKMLLSRKQQQLTDSTLLPHEIVLYIVHKIVLLCCSECLQSDFKVHYVYRSLKKPSSAALVPDFFYLFGRVPRKLKYYYNYSRVITPIIQLSQLFHVCETVNEVKRVCTHRGWPKRQQRQHLLHI